MVFPLNGDTLKPPPMAAKARNGWVVCCLIIFLLPLSTLAAGNYDVSYFWTKGSLKAVKAYAGKVKKVLGDDVAKRVGIVRNKNGVYGVIYDRNGSYQTTYRVAQHHARLLYQAGVSKQKGVHSACPIRDQGYVFIEKPNSIDSGSHKRSSAVDSLLEAEIDRYIKRLRRRGILSQTDRTSFVIFDISQQKKVVSINEDRPMMAASLIKNFVMLAYFHQVKHKRLQHTNKNRLHLRRMIQKSYNSSTNYFIRLLGGPRAVNRILKRHYPYLEHTHIVEYIPSGGRTYRNKTSAHDMNRFYNQLWLGHLPYSAKMKYYLGLPKMNRLHDKTCIPKGVRVFNKTGTVYGMVGDSGVLVITDTKGKQRAYILTGIIEDRTKTNRRNRSQPFASWVKRRSDVLRRVSEAGYEYIYKVHYGGSSHCQDGGIHSGS
ncbi:serine hydrolase [Candidatus Poribacteria bacterium]|nr:serine hydrolase [Candidatus Poribacteria bacterium]